MQESITFCASYSSFALPPGVKHPWDTILAHPDLNATFSIADCYRVRFT